MFQRLQFYTGGLFVLLLVISSVQLSGQSIPYSAAQRQQIEQLRQAFQKVHDTNYNRALALAKQLGRPIEIRLRDGAKMTLQGFDDRGHLSYYVTNSATRAGITTRTNSFYAGGSLGLNLSGSSASVQGKLGVWDGGAVRASHVEMRGRVTQIDSASASTTEDDEEHPSHVSGIMMASGLNPAVRGMAYRATLKAWDYNNDVAEMTAASPNLLISNHSYGYNAGWYPNPDAASRYAWIWYGDTTVSRTFDYKFGIYDSRTQSWDRIAVNAPNYLIVLSAGNSRGYNGPAAGEAYILGNYTTSRRTVVSTIPRDNQAGYDVLPPTASSKNALSVGAVSILRNGYQQPSDVQNADFSSWGPTDDGRIKPDLVGAGVSILSCNSTSDSSYVTLSGTSMSSPNVAGSLLLLQELYAQQNAGKYMRSSTLKGLAIHTTDEAGAAPGPDYQNGWGLLNMERAGRVLLNTDRNYLLNELTLSQGQTYSLTMVASGRGPLMSTISWTDPAGTPTATLNDRTPKLVNDLDIRISDGVTTTQPWLLDPANPGNAATQGDNIRDNVEQILVANPVPGRMYTITVTHKGTLSGNQQNYALLLSGIGGTTYCASAATTDADSRIDRVQFGSIDKAGAGGCTTVTDNTTLVADVQAGQTLPLTITTGSCGTARNTIVKAFVDWNLDGDFDDANETVATSGVLRSGAAFTGNVSVPTSVTIGQFARLRIVDVATEDPAAVTPCGAYAVGETQDFLLRFVQVTNDVGVVALVAPDSGFCAQSGEITLAVRLQNFGSATQTTVPVSVSILDQNENPVTTLTGSLATLGAFQQGLLTLQIPAGTALQAGRTYRFVAATTLAGDQVGTNNQVTVTRTTGALPGAGVFAVLDCGGVTPVILRNTGDGVATWYDALTGGNLLAAGNLTSTPVRPANNVFYASQNEFSGRLGPATKGEFGSGSYGGAYSTQPLLSANVPLMLATARLYIGTPGRITFSIKRLDETVVSTVTLDVATTRTLPTSATASGGQFTDDPNDPGAVYPLNLRIPAAGEYKLTIDYEGGATIFRNTTAVAGSTITRNTFPVSIPGIISSKGSLLASSSTTADTIKYAWYYLYDLQVRPLGCSSGQRVPVTSTAGTTPTATITPSSSVSVCQGSSVTLLTAVNSSDALLYQWLRNGQLITGATSASYAVSTAGQYSVQVRGSCPTTSTSAVTVSLRTAETPAITQNANVLISNATIGNQWLFNGVAITGATSATYVAVQSGRYSVRGNVNGCGEVVSGEVYVTILAAEPVVADLFRVYPNPAVKTITVEATTTSSPVPTLQIIDSRGALLKSTAMKRSGNLDTATVDVDQLPAGVFFIQLIGDLPQPTRIKRFTKQ